MCGVWLGLDQRDGSADPAGVRGWQLLRQDLSDAQFDAVSHPVKNVQQNVQHFVQQDVLRVF
jgi:hypothetical protein